MARKNKRLQPREEQDKRDKRRVKRALKFEGRKK